MTEAFSAGYALLIGVGQTAHRPWSLPLTVKDATVLRSILVDPSLCAFPDTAEHIRLLTDASASADRILDGLAWLRDTTAHDPEATAVVFYAGHGWLERTTQQYYLVHHATRPDDVPGTALLAEAFTDALRQVRAKRLLAIFDCCHAQGMATARGEPTDNTPDLPREIEVRPLPEPLAHALKQGEGRAVLTSSRGTQRSWEWPSKSHGIFTYHLLEALQGAGNLPGDDMVRLSNLMNHLSRKVPESARTLCKAEQTPFFDQATEDFPIAMLRGGRGLPTGGWEAVKHETRYDQPPAVQVRTMSGGNLQVGDRRVEQHGKYNLTAETMSGMAIGDAAQVFNQPSRPVTQNFDPQRNVNTGGGDYAEGNIDKRSGAFVSGGTVYGPVIGSNSGNVTTSYGSLPAANSRPVTLDQAVAAVRQARTDARQAGDAELGEDLDGILGALEAARNAEQVGKTARRVMKLRDAQADLRQLAAAQPQLRPVRELVDQVA